MTRLTLISLLTLCSLMHSAFGQKNKIEKELHSLKAYRDTLAKKTCRGDTLKQARYAEKTIQFLAYKKKYLLKIDSVDKAIRDLNAVGGKYYYYLRFGKPTYFDWSDCNTEVLSDSTTLTRLPMSDTDDEYIDCKFKIEKVAKLDFDFFGLSTEQTFYREDINHSPDH